MASTSLAGGWNPSAPGPGIDCQTRQTWYGMGGHAHQMKSTILQIQIRTNHGICECPAKSSWDPGMRPPPVRAKQGRKIGRPLGRCPGYHPDLAPSCGAPETPKSLPPGLPPRGLTNLSESPPFWRCIGAGWRGATPPRPCPYPRLSFACLIVGRQVSRSGHLSGNDRLGENCRTQGHTCVNLSRGHGRANGRLLRSPVIAGKDFGPPRP
jgi:hypothetical protein